MAAGAKSNQPWIDIIVERLIIFRVPVAASSVQIEKNLRQHQAVLSETLGHLAVTLQQPVSLALGRTESICWRLGTCEGRLDRVIQQLANTACLVGRQFRSSKLQLITGNGCRRELLDISLKLRCGIGIRTCTKIARLLAPLTSPARLGQELDKLQRSCLFLA